MAQGRGVQRKLGAVPAAGHARRGSRAGHAYVVLARAPGPPRVFQPSSPCRRTEGPRDRCVVSKALRHRGGRLDTGGKDLRRCANCRTEHGWSCLRVAASPAIRSGTSTRPSRSRGEGRTILNLNDCDVPAVTLSETGEKNGPCRPSAGPVLGGRLVWKSGRP